MRELRTKHALIILLIVAVITGCSKFDNGPCISFRGKGTRLEGEWLLKYWTVDGTDSLQYWNNYFGNECVFTFNNQTSDLGYFLLDVLWGTADSNYYHGNGAYDGFVDEFLSITFYYTDSGCTAFPLNFLAEPHPNNSLVEWTITKLKYDEVWFEMDVNNKHYELHLENIKKF